MGAHARAASCMHAGACAGMHGALHPAGRTACRCISASRVPAGHSAELIAARQWRAACFSASGKQHAAAAGKRAALPPKSARRSGIQGAQRYRAGGCDQRACALPPQCRRRIAASCRLNCCTPGYEQAPARSKSSALNCCGAKAGRQQAESEPGAMAVERFAASGARAAGAAAEGAVEERYCCCIAGKQQCSCAGGGKPKARSEAESKRSAQTALHPAGHAACSSALASGVTSRA